MDDPAVQKVPSGDAGMAQVAAMGRHHARHNGRGAAINGMGKSATTRPPAGSQLTDAGPAPPVRPQEPGEILRAARLRQRLSLAHVAAATRIQIPYLEAIEDDDYSVLPSPVHTRAFLRIYARYLDLPTDADLVTRYERRRSPRSKRVAVRPATRRRRLARHLLVPLAAVATVGVSVLLLLLVSAAVAGRPNLPPGRTAGLRSVPPVAPQPAAPAGRVEVVAEATEGVWLRVTIDGQLAYEGLLAAGQQARWIGQQTVQVRAGNAGALHVTVNGRASQPLGAQGQVIERTFHPE